MDLINLGDVVRFREIVDPGDEDSRFVVVEDNGDRLMIRFICNLPIPPIQVVPRSDVCKA